MEYNPGLDGVEVCTLWNGWHELFSITNECKNKISKWWNKFIEYKQYKIYKITPLMY